MLQLFWENQQFFHLSKPDTDLFIFYLFICLPPHSQAQISHLLPVFSLYAKLRIEASEKKEGIKACFSKC